MVTIFTLCSANYLAQALTLGDSVKGQNPNYHFVIGLVDVMPKELTLAGCPFEVIPVEQLDIPGFWDMVAKYDIVELNTAVKPFYLEHLYRRDARVNAVIYLDPDILVYASLEPLEKKLSGCNLILTPHNCTYDNSDANLDYEMAMLNFGVYNLGFIATSRSEVTFAFIKWWEKRLQHLCYYQPGSGFFVDQLWATLAPLYFSGVYVEKAPGYNVAYWNLFERRLCQRDGIYFVNDEHRLMFYHFSGYNPGYPGGIVKRPRAHVPTFAERPEMRPLFDEYGRRVLARNYSKFKLLKYSLRRNTPQTRLTFKKAVKKNVRKVLGSLPPKFQASVVRLAQSTINSFK
jgi:hypothetical protein